MNAYENSWLADVHTALPKVQKVIKERGDYLLKNDLRFHEDTIYRDAFAIIEIASLVLDLEERGEKNDAKACWNVFLIQWEMLSVHRKRIREMLNFIPPQS